MEGRTCPLTSSQSPPYPHKMFPAISMRVLLRGMDSSNQCLVSHTSEKSGPSLNKKDHLSVTRGWGGVGGEWLVGKIWDCHTFNEFVNPFSVLVMFKTGWGCGSPPCMNSTNIQYLYICAPPLYIVVNFKPICLGWSIFLDTLIVATVSTSGCAKKEPGV